VDASHILIQRPQGVSVSFIKLKGSSPCLMSQLGFRTLYAFAPFACKLLPSPTLFAFPLSLLICFLRRLCFSTPPVGTTFSAHVCPLRGLNDHSSQFRIALTRVCLACAYRRQMEISLVCFILLHYASACLPHLSYRARCSSHSLQ
jgi:hypothetical protein